ncbi:leucine-rich repeat extensin-like protein 3 [Iris pallida]|uniref:Leucine-rich repeat extensin-like protein 3 n=1 Tax=Iris pallida TaxID=29817 RepID=A0AAX6HZ01_IRIPA|nr:leucine-rich repeat extensin-like protein 3 [Iris pallida]
MSGHCPCFPFCALLSTCFWTFPSPLEIRLFSNYTSESSSRATQGIIPVPFHLFGSR